MSYAEAARSGTVFSLTLESTLRPRQELPMRTPFLIVLLTASASAQAYVYRVTDLGVLPGRTSSVARGMSPDGTRIVGWCTDRAFLWQEGQGMRELLPLPGYTRAFGYDVNDAGIACGQAGLEVSGAEPSRAVMWDAAGMPVNLGTLGGGRFSMAHAINRTGAIVGTTEVLPTTTLWHAFLWQPGTGMVDLTPGPTDAFGRGLNDFDQATGYSATSAWRFTSPSTLQFLGQPTGFAFTAGFAINDAGQVCASATSASGNVERNARFTGPIGWEVLGGIGQHNTPTGINSFGQVVGTSTNVPRAFVFSDGLGLQDLNTMVDPAGLWFILQGYEINDRGQISGHAFSNAIAETRAIRLDPNFTQVRGAGCAGGNGHVPKLAVAGLPAGGRRISILLAEGRPGSVALLQISATPVSAPLPGGCTLLVGLDAISVLLSLDPIGRAILPIDLPAGIQPGFLHLQYVSIDPTAANGLFALSNAVQLQMLR
jgi:probable HAF family extracellular repeat protein